MSTRMAFVAWGGLIVAVACAVALRSDAAVALCIGLAAGLALSGSI